MLLVDQWFPDFLSYFLVRVTLAISILCLLYKAGMFQELLATWKR